MGVQYKIYLKTFIFFIFLFLLWQIAEVDVYTSESITSLKNRGFTQKDIAFEIQQTTGGGYIVTRRENYWDTGVHEFSSYRLNSTGGVVWRKWYVGLYPQNCLSIQQTTDGGYIAAGSSKSFSYNPPVEDIAIYKSNSCGDKSWFKHYGGMQADYCASIRQTSDLEYILAGATESYTWGAYDFAIYKLDSSGNKLWFKHYGGYSDDQAESIQQTSDGGYIVAGRTKSFSYGSWDIAIYKLDSSGNKVWFKHYGGTSSDIAHSIQQTSDGGYILAGKSNSYSWGSYDFAIYKLDSSGNKLWFKHYGGTSSDIAYSIQQTSDGGYIVAGHTDSFSHKISDFAIYKLDSNGNKVWFKLYGGFIE